MLIGREKCQVPLVHKLLSWYNLNQRDLPWRRNPDPYKTLVSEIMLQQTRVEAVLPLYERFMQRFPSIKDLAFATQDEVLTFWQGLGYYSRARRLHQAAQIIMTEHDGLIPSDKNTLQALPGIGDYTCGAILSIAFHQPEVAMDGNLLRVGARLFLIRDPINRTKAKTAIKTRFESIVPVERPGDFNQALMDLGSSICLPKHPRCGECPLSDHCQAYVQGEAMLLPIKDAPKPPVPVQVQLYLVESDKTILFRQRLAGGFLQGMWELPWYETDTLQVAEEYGWISVPLESGSREKVYEMEYIFSHRHWFMTIFHYKVVEPFYTPQDENTLYRWQPLHSVDTIALPTVFKKVLELVQNSLSG